MIAITLICSFLSPFLPAGKENTKSVSASTTVSIDDCSQTAKEIAESRPLCNWLDDESRDANHIYYTLDEENKTATVGSDSTIHNSSGYICPNPTFISVNPPLIIPDYVEKDGICYTVTKIGSRSFDQTPFVDTVYLPDTIESIGKEAFFNNYQYIYIGAGVKEIGSRSLSSSLNFIDYNMHPYIQLSPQNPYLIMKEHALMNKDQTILYYHEQTETAAYSYIIPNTVKEIRSGAFYDDASLLHVTLPDSLIYIDELSFAGCSNLYQVEFGNSLQSIGRQAFLDCGALQGIILPDTVSHIGKLAFWGTNIHYFIGANHASYEFIDSDESPGHNTHLFGCGNLKYLTLSDHYSTLYSTTLDSYQGESPHNIKKIVLPPTLTNAATYPNHNAFTGITFYGLSSQKEIAEKLGVNFVDINGHTHDYTKTTLTEPGIHTKGVQAEICSVCGDIQNASYTAPLSASSAVLTLYISGSNGTIKKDCVSLAEALNSMPHDKYCFVHLNYKIVFKAKQADFYLPEGMTSLPYVQSLTLSGCIAPTGSGNFSYTRIWLTDNLALQGDLILADTQLVFQSRTRPIILDLQKYTLKITTNNCSFIEDTSSKLYPFQITGNADSCLWVSDCDFSLFGGNGAYHDQSYSLSVDSLKLTSDSKYCSFTIYGDDDTSVDISTLKIPNSKRRSATLSPLYSSVSINKITTGDSRLHFKDIRNKLSIGDIVAENSSADITFDFGCSATAPLPKLISISGITNIPLQLSFDFLNATEEDYKNFRSSFCISCPKVPVSKLKRLYCYTPPAHGKWADFIFHKDEEGQAYLIDAPTPTDTPTATTTPVSTDAPTTTETPTPSPMPSPLVSAALSSPEDTLPSNEVVEKGNDEGEGKEETKIETSTDIRKKLTLSSLKVTLSQNNLPILVWKKNAHATTYEIYRSSQKNKGYKLLKKLSASQAKYKDSNAKPGKKYYYRIRLGQTAEDKTTVYGKDSAIVSIRTLKLPSPVITSKKGITANRIHYIQLQLKKYGGTNIVIYIKKKGEKERKLKLTSSSIKEQKGIFKLQYTPKNKIYYLRLKTYRKKGNKIYYSKYSNVIKIRL